MPKNKSNYKKKVMSKRQKKKWSMNQLVKIVEESGIESQKMNVRYFQRSYTDLNPNRGIYNPVVYSIQPTGVDNLLPNYPNLTNSQRQIYIDTISIYFLFTENDTGLNSLKHEYIRHMLVYKDDETDASVSDVTAMFKSDSISGSLSVTEESLLAVIPQSGHIYKTNDSGWLQYDSTLGGSLSTGIISTDIPNYVVPQRKYRKTLRLKKTFQIADNGTLIGWKIPTLALLYTGTLSDSPDCTVTYHMYYKVLA